MEENKNEVVVVDNMYVAPRAEVKSYRNNYNVTIGDKKYIVFKWNKFAIRYDGLTREYLYTEPFFLNALVASFTSFSASAQNIIDEFARREMSVGINKAIDVEEVNEIASLNEKNTKVEIAEEISE